MLYNQEGSHTLEINWEAEQTVPDDDEAVLGIGVGYGFNGAYNDVVGKLQDELPVRT